MNDWGDEAFIFERRRFWWRWSNVAGGGVWTLREVTGTTDHLISYHGRDVEIGVQPDMEPVRYYWWTRLKPYTAPRDAKNPKPSRPEVKLWGIADSVEAARYAAFDAFVNYRHAPDVTDVVQIGMEL